MSDALAIAVSHHREGRLPQAELLYRDILATDPKNADALHLLGLVIYQRGQPEEAIRYIAAAIELAPNQAAYYSNLGRVYHALGRREAELTAYRRALELDAAFAPAYLHMALALDEAGSPDEAMAYLRRVLVIKPDYAQAHFNLGLLHQQRGALDEAVAAYVEAARHNPRLAAAHFNRGNALRQQQQLEQAAAAYQQALALEPDRSDARLNLGQVLGELGRLEQSLACFRTLAASHPQLAETHDGMAVTLLACGDPAAARDEYLRALELRPDWAAAHSGAMACEYYLPGVSEASLAESHAQWDRRHAAPLRAQWRPYANDRNPDRRLRWGLVAPEFGDNPVSRLLVRALEALDPRQCEVFCYADRVFPGPLADRLRRAASHWRDTRNLADAALAEQIRSEPIDVLFDLAGHTAENRLLALARKPAPIQIAWIAYPGTTGMEAMDYIVADGYQIPPESEPFYRERVWRLPDRYVVYDPPADCPAVGPLPAESSGYVTFGSFNNPLKISAAVLDLWASILGRQPHARLVLKYFNLENALCQRPIVDRLAERGIAAGRVELLGASPWPDFLAAYHRIDVALDPLPYSGGLTTCDALWMGVPVIACRGETFAGRQSAGHLATVGLAELIADDPAEYVEKAVALAADLTRLAALRAGLRDRVLASPLCNGRRLAENLQRLVRQAWQQWVANP